MSLGVDTDLSQQLLTSLMVNDTIISNVAFPTTPSADLKAVLDRLLLCFMIDCHQLTQRRVVLEAEGVDICVEGNHSPEYIVWKAVHATNGKSGFEELQALMGHTAAKFCVGITLKEQWKKKEGAWLFTNRDEAEDTTKQVLARVRQINVLSDFKIFNELRKRNLVRLAKDMSYTITKGSKYARRCPKSAKISQQTCWILVCGSQRILSPTISQRWVPVRSPAPSIL